MISPDEGGRGNGERRRERYSGSEDNDEESDRNQIMSEIQQRIGGNVFGIE